MTNDKEKQTRKPLVSTSIHIYFLVALRIFIGWQFLYEGIIKLLDQNWTSAGYLIESSWIFSGLFHWIAANSEVLQVVDFVNTWGLILIGLGLFFGLFTRLATISGILLLGLYYIANPPFIESSTRVFHEGHYLIIDKNFIELTVLFVLLFFRTGKFIGLDYFISRLWKGKIKSEIIEKKISTVDKSFVKPSLSPTHKRRELLKQLITLPMFGSFIYAFYKKRKWESFEEKYLTDYAEDRPDATSGSTLKTFIYSDLKDMKGHLPYGKIKNIKISRLFLGGNLIGGWAHARDLIYASKLVKAYHTDRKVFDTFQLAEACGINTILTNPQLCRVINEYWRKEGGKIQFISDCAYGKDIIKGIKLSIDGGAHACYVQGGIADQMVNEGKVEEIGKALDFIRQNGLPAGIGAHKLETIQECVKAGIKPDFWVKTLHHTNYWSAKPEEEHDNIWCTNPDGTIAFMNDLEEPWIAFKILAAGAIHPKEGFPYAFKNGADFICVGMYDFQIVDDVNIALNTLNGGLERKRPWQA
ncbi:MAG: DoxX family protein [Bacteroidetes bacterium]|nr:DoxX family protein [Bacteroidota bacterium]